MTWQQVVKAAGLVRAVLKTLGLTAWAKMTGGRGLHVVVPTTPARDVAECLQFSRDVSEAIARSAGARVWSAPEVIPQRCLTYRDGNGQ